MTRRATVTHLHAEIEALKSDVDELVRAGSDEATEVERLVKERDEARAGMAYILDHATYGDSYGVHGSDFECCHFCQGGGAPGVALEHTPDCPVSKYPNAVTEWFAEMAENNKDRETAEAQRDAALEALKEADEALCDYACATDDVPCKRSASQCNEMCGEPAVFARQAIARASRTLEGE